MFEVTGEWRVQCREIGQDYAEAEGGSILSTLTPSL
jgi:hypothetical protein